MYRVLKKIGLKIVGLTILLTAHAAVTQQAVAQYEPNIYPSFLTNNNSARSLALGGASVAMTCYTGAGHLNPATIGNTGLLQFGTNISANQNQPLRLRSPDYRTGRWDSRWSGSYHTGRLGAEISVQTYRYLSDAGNPDDYRNRAFTAALAYRLTEHFQIGGSFNYMDIGGALYLRPVGFTPEVPTQEPITISQSGNGMSFDLGVHYNNRWEKGPLNIRSDYGWSLTDLGPVFNYKLINSDDEVYALKAGLPMYMRLGGKIEFEQRNYWYKRSWISLSLLLQWSHQLARTDNEGDPYGPFRALFGSWGTYESRIGEWEANLTDQIITHTGAELSILDIFHARTGRIFNPDFGPMEDVFSYGFGLDLYYLAVDYTKAKRLGEFPSVDGSTVNNIYEKNIWQCTVRLPLNGDQSKNFWPAIIQKIK